MAKKAKWLEEGTQESLLIVIKETLSADEIDAKAQKKALNATTELIERLPKDEVTIIDNLDNLVKLAGTIKDQYDAEADMVSEDGEDEEITEDDATEAVENTLDALSKKELKAMAKDLGLKVDKKAGKDDIIALIQEAQTEEDEDDIEEDGEDEVVGVEEVLASLSLKELKALAKEAEINLKGKKQDALVEELAAHDDIEDLLIEAGHVADADDEEEDEVDYSELSKAELKALMKERGFKVSKKTTVEEMIETLENN